MKKDLEKVVGEISAVIDILQATSEFYKRMESAEASDLLVANDLVCAGLREKVNILIPIINNI